MKKLVGFLSMLSLATSALSEEVMTQCPYELYGTTTSGAAGASNLLALDPLTGGSILVAPITGNGANQVTGVSFHNNGKIYAVGYDGDNTSSLMVINCKTGSAYIIGPTGIPSAPGLTITDISFDAENTLWAYVNKPGSGSDEVGTIDIETGEYTALGNSGINDSGNAISHDLDSNLYHAGRLNLSAIDNSTGAATAVAALGFSAPADTNPRINAMDVRPSTGVMFVGINNKASGSGSPAENYLGTVNLSTGVVSLLSASPARVDNLAGIAFNPKHKGEIPFK